MTLLCIYNTCSLKIYISNYAIPVTVISPISRHILSVAQSIGVSTLSIQGLEAWVEVICLQLLLTDAT